MTRAMAAMLPITFLVIGDIIELRGGTASDLGDAPSRL
jgi:hypothetical protein